MRHGEVDAGPQRDGARQREPDQNRAGNCCAGQGNHQLSLGQRRHQIVDYRALDLADEETEARIGEGILHHPHHDQPGCDEGCEIDPEHHSPAATHRHGENNQKQHGGYRRSPNRLGLDLEKAADFLHIERPQPEPVNPVDHGYSLGRKIASSPAQSGPARCRHGSGGIWNGSCGLIGHGVATIGSPALWQAQGS